MEIKPILILGAKGIAKSAGEIFKSHQIVVYGFLDDDKKLHGTNIDDASVLGSTDDEGFLKFIGHKCDAFVATDDIAFKKKLTEMLVEERHVMPVNAIHQSAILATSAQFGYGNFIQARVIIGADVKINHHTLIHSGAIIEQDVQIESFVQIGTGAIIGMGVVLEEGAFVGAGAVIVGGITIGKNARVGAGSVVIESVKAKDTIFGNPAKSIK